MAGEMWSEQKLRIFGLFASAPDQKRWGWELINQTSLNSDVVYPILNRLAAIGFLERSYERIDRRVTSRPPRIFYKITEAGMKGAANLRGMLTT